jgi:peptidoglycan/xylan/chitin deacetylase (PgdA/CDA1 family)
VVFYYTLPEIEEEIKYTEHVIREVTGETTRLFRPPKAWLRKDIKNKIKSMGYDIMLWSINSKDWVGFSAENMVRHMIRNIGPGDILLFHDSGSVMKAEGGNRAETVKAVRQLIKELKELGFEFITR